MTLKSARVPDPFVAVFEQAEKYVEGLFDEAVRRPDQGTLHVGGERYVMMRCESLYVGWFDAMASTFGEEVAREFIYNTGREIGRRDSKDFASRLSITDPAEKLSTGPVHFAHAGWAFVHILPDSLPTTDDSYFLHYYHPNTFESEVLKKRGATAKHCACLLSAGYSSGWCTEAFGIEVHGREIRCAARGDTECEFIMAPSEKLHEHEARVLG